jgi:hypothetical protein
MLDAGDLRLFNFDFSSEDVWGFTRWVDTVVKF